MSLRGESIRCQYSTLRLEIVASNIDMEGSKGVQAQVLGLQKTATALERVAWTLMDFGQP